MALTMSGIEKAFNRNKVLKNVSFSLEKGEIHALIGENGAGKSTLMNILGGVLRPDAGEIALDGKPLVFSSPRDSMNAGIAFIHQELNLVNDLSIYENLFIGREEKQGPFLRREHMIEASRKVLSRMKVELDPRTMVRELDASYKQIIEIARALLMQATIIIMDEPTTSLTEVEIDRVFTLMRTLKSEGVSIIFISHKLNEVLTICDSFTVLRDGCVVKTGRTQGETELSLARYMVGHDVRTEKLSRNVSIGGDALEVRGLSRERAFHDVSFTLREGEILGFTGLLGDGRSELFRAVFGAEPADSGEILVRGKRVRVRSTGDARRLGIGYVPRDRKENGILKDLSILENGSIVIYEELTRLLLIDHKRERANMQKQIHDLSIKLDSPDDLITSLSGGNQQKTIIARWLMNKPTILFMDEPTHGIDIGAKNEIYKLIDDLTKQGLSIVLISSEMPEVLSLCDRIIFMHHGYKRGELNNADASQEKLMSFTLDSAMTEDEKKERAMSDAG